MGSPVNGSSADSPPSRDVELSVVLVNHNGAGCVRDTLEALRDNTSASSTECILIDSGSSDGSWLGLEKFFPGIRVVRNTVNVGFCRGCNQGAELARGRMLAFVNFDGQVLPDWDGPLRRVLDDPSVAIAGGVLLRPDGRTVEAAGLAIAPNMATFGLNENALRATLPAAPFDVTAASGALLMMRRQDFLGIGGFYEPIWMYGEEADLALRAPGRVVIDPTSGILHEMGHASGPARSLTRLYWPSRNRLINAARHLPLRALLVSLAASAAFDALTALQLRSAKCTSAIARGWFAGLRCMPRERHCRTPDQRAVAATKIVTLRAAARQQRRLHRTGLSAS